MSFRRRAAGLIGLGVMCSQAGHLLAYSLRFGAAAERIQSSGAHGYYPTLAKTGLGILAASLLAGLFLIGLARIAHGRPLDTASAPNWFRLLGALFTIQLLCFVAQETVEAAVAGAPASSVVALLLWGTAGQLPIAILAALALRWLLTTCGPAIAVLQLPRAASRLVRSQLVTTVEDLEPLELRSGPGRACAGKRAPPLAVRLSSV